MIEYLTALLADVKDEIEIMLTGRSLRSVLTALKEAETRCAQWKTMAVATAQELQLERALRRKYERTQQAEKWS